MWFQLRFPNHKRFSSRKKTASLKYDFLLLFKVEYVIQLFYVWSVFKGSEGFKNARRGTNFAGQQAAIAAAKVVILKCLQK